MGRLQLLDSAWGAKRLAERLDGQDEPCKRARGLSFRACDHSLQIRAQLHVFVRAAICFGDTFPCLSGDSRVTREAEHRRQHVAICYSSGHTRGAQSFSTSWW